jgi:hypothetical protein
MSRRPSSGFGGSQYTAPAASPATQTTSLDQFSPDDYSTYINYDLYANLSLLYFATDNRRTASTDAASEVFGSAAGMAEPIFKTDDLSDDDHLDELNEAKQQLEDDARSHELYSARPRDDGNYYCPCAAESNCKHEPTRLKCNYDKYIDSHLRPFRCKDPDCADQPFSSMACLLRHQREAHGMHGHGQKPYLCEYPNCDRSKPGQGFPRTYNLNDHMKRVHNHVKSPGQKAPVATKRVFAMGRKRSAAGSEGKQARVEKKPRPTKAELEATAALKRERQLQALRQQWSQHISSIMAHMQDLEQGAVGMVALEHVEVDIAALRRLGMDLSKSE